MRVSRTSEFVLSRLRGYRKGYWILGAFWFMAFAVYPKGPSTLLSYTLQNPNLHNYYPKTEYLIIGSFGPLGLNPKP